jgi:hypothetical protein
VTELISLSLSRAILDLAAWSAGTKKIVSCDIMSLSSKRAMVVGLDPEQLECRFEAEQ